MCLMQMIFKIVIILYLGLNWKGDAVHTKINQYTKTT